CVIFLYTPDQNVYSPNSCWLPNSLQLVKLSSSSIGNNIVIFECMFFGEPGILLRTSGVILYLEEMYLQKCADCSILDVDHIGKISIMNPAYLTGILLTQIKCTRPEIF
ncbi:unnamed protein product, partial [Staurois parvus]